MQRASDFEEEDSQSPKVPLWATLAILLISEPTQQDPAHITPFGGIPTVQQNALKPPIAMTGPALEKIPSGGGTAVFSGTPQKKQQLKLTPDGTDSPKKTIVVKKEKKTRNQRRKRKNGASLVIGTKTTPITNQTRPVITNPLLKKHML